MHMQQTDTGPGLALITGATSGIGAEFARQLAAAGWDLMLHGRREALLQELAGRLVTEHGVSVRILLADLASEQGIAAVERTVAGLSELRLIVNNAGYGDPGLFQERSSQSMVDMMRVHNEAVVRITRAGIGNMLAAGQGGVINVSSVAAWLPGRASPMYYATKAFLNSFSRCLAADLRGTGVRVQALCPGFTHTEFHAREKLAKFDKSRTPRWLWMDAKDVVRISLARLGRGSVIVIPGWHNRLFAWIGGHEWLYRMITRR
jgi:short-subunit dehydrogenase